MSPPTSSSSLARSVTTTKFNRAVVRTCRPVIVLLPVTLPTDAAQFVVVLDVYDRRRRAPGDAAVVRPLARGACSGSSPPTRSPSAGCSSPPAGPGDLLGRRRMFQGRAPHVRRRVARLRTRAVGPGALIAADAPCRASAPPSRRRAALALRGPRQPDRHRAVAWLHHRRGSGAARRVGCSAACSSRRLGWPAVFAVNVPLCAIGALLAPRLLPESRRHGAHASMWPARSRSPPRSGCSSLGFTQVTARACRGGGRRSPPSSGSSAVPPIRSSRRGRCAGAGLTRANTVCAGAHRDHDAGDVPGDPLPAGGAAAAPPWRWASGAPPFNLAVVAGSLPGAGACSDVRGTRRDSRRSG